MKEIVAEEIAKKVKDKQLIGVGTGSTVELAVMRIGERVQKENLDVCVVPTSLQTSWQCQKLGLKVIYQGYKGAISWGFDGADAVDDRLWLVKGKGGALLQEKILAARCKEFIVIVDESKLVKNLGDCAIPVEVIPEAISLAEHGLERLGAKHITLRPASGKHGPIITEKGNVILDAKFDRVEQDLERQIKSIIGVVESGLFIDYTREVMVGSASGVRTITK